jgi:hypothetical protein
VCENQVLGQFLAIGFVAPIMFDLNVQVEGAFTAVVFTTRIVGANETSFNLFGRPAHVLLPRFDWFGISWL